MNKGIFYNLPSKYKFSTTFAAQIKPLISEDVDKYLAVASQSNLQKFLPDNINFNKKVDFLGFAGEAFIANRTNSNDDGVKTEEAISIAELFPLSLVDLEHNRNQCIGVITTASFAEYGTNKPLTKEEIKDTKSPFSCVIGGIIWRVVSPDLANAIEESNDPSSELFGKIYLSWELAFTDVNLLLIDAKKKNFEDGKLITDVNEINKLEGKLRAFGGKGITDDGLKIVRVPVNDVIPLGVGIVENPAAQVKPIVVNSSQSEELLIK